MKFYQIVIIIMLLTLIFQKNASCSAKEIDDDSKESNESDETTEKLRKHILHLGRGSKVALRSENSLETARSDESSKNLRIGLDKRSCKGRDSKLGICTDFKTCKGLFKKLHIRLDAKQLVVITAPNKFCRSQKNGNVCCPIFNDTSDVPTKTKHMPLDHADKYPSVPFEDCGLVHTRRTYDKIIGGRDSEIGAWPWLALLAYDNVMDISFLCSGTLVTRQHVITAAHCIVFNLIFVRLGEFDLSRANETNHLDINFAEIINSTFDHKTGRDDVAILVLEKRITFTDFISPICLPIQTELRQKSYEGAKPFVAGWGYTTEDGNSAPILQELQITVLHNRKCLQLFKEQGILDREDQFDESVICAGEVEGGRDTCQGDSGGPLMMPEKRNEILRFYLIGIVSAGHGCAHKKLAASYTKVSYYMDWILENLKFK